MTGQSQRATKPGTEPSLGPLDDDSVDRIDVHLERALQASETDESDFHVRHARQLLEACRQR